MSGALIHFVSHNNGAFWLYPCLCGVHHTFCLRTTLLSGWLGGETLVDQRVSNRCNVCDGTWPEARSEAADEFAFDTGHMVSSCSIFTRHLGCAQGTGLVVSALQSTPYLAHSQRCECKPRVHTRQIATRTQARTQFQAHNTRITIHLHSSSFIFVHR